MCFRGPREVLVPYFVNSLLGVRLSLFRWHIAYYGRQGFFVCSRIGNEVSRCIRKSYIRNKEKCPGIYYIQDISNCVFPYRTHYLTI